MPFKPDWRDALSIILLGVSIYLILQLPDRRYGFSILILSLMYLVIRERDVLPASSANAQTVALHRGALSVIRALNLKGSAIFVPPRGRLKEDKVFVPLSRGASRVPHLNEGDVFNPGLFGSEMGIMLPSPGRELLKELERGGSLDTGALGSDQCEALTEPFMGLEGLYGKVRIFDRGEEVKVELRGGEALQQIRAIEESHGDFLTQYPPPPVAALLSAVARVKKRPVKIKSALRRGEVVEILLEGVEMG